MSKHESPWSLREYLFETFMKYYDTAYSLRDQAVVQERRNLLKEKHSVVAEPYIELQTEYANAEQTFLEIGHKYRMPEFASFVNAGLFPKNVKSPYSHQLAALEASLAKKNIVIATGTGSGKTESFLLPILFRLVRESKSWQSSRVNKAKYWWKEVEPKYFSSRSSETRPSAVRALVIYPMNALVEDQMTRLRSSPFARNSRMV